MSGLRERNRRAAMDQIQQAALALFDRDGYQAVTIADIARAAQVSESTFYRLFRTKEGLFTTPLVDGPMQLRATTVDELYDEVGAIVAGYDWPGLRWVLEEPEVRRAVLAALDGFAAVGAERLASCGMSGREAAVAVRVLLFGVYFTALEQWHRDGRTTDFADYYALARRHARGS